MMVMNMTRNWTMLSPSNDEGEWVLNKNNAFKYVMSNSNATYETENSLIKKPNKTMTLYILICSNQACNQNYG